MAQPLAYSDGALSSLKGYAGMEVTQAVDIRPI
jgi:hypothetical protein